MLEISSAHL